MRLITCRLCPILADLTHSFGGTDGQYHYNDTWSFDVNTRTWKELTCIGFIPVPREGHAAALVDDVIYVFGGRGVDGKDLGDLAAYKISSSLKFLLIESTQLTRNSYRSTLVHVPEYGTFAEWTIWPRYGLGRNPRIRVGGRVFHFRSTG